MTYGASQQFPDPKIYTAAGPHHPVLKFLKSISGKCPILSKRGGGYIGGAITFLKTCAMNIILDEHYV